MGIGGLLNKAKDAASKAQDEVAGKAAALKEAGENKISEIMGDFEEARPLIKEAGYSLTELEIELGVSPKLIPHFVYDEQGAEKTDQALEALKDNTLGKSLLLGLIKAGDLQKKISVSGLGFSHIAISIGAIPSIILQYK